MLLVAMLCYIITRKRPDSSSHQDVNLGALPDIGTTTGNMTSNDAYGMAEIAATTTGNMTSNDAYGMAEMPAEEHNYAYITAISDNK